MLNDVMRTSLYIPGNNPRFIAKAPTSGADIVTFDIEDAVPPQEKANARKMTAESLKMAAEGGSEVYVRINGWHTEWTNDDLEAVVRPGLDGITLPKCEGLADVRRLDNEITRLASPCPRPATPTT